VEEGVFEPGRGEFIVDDLSRNDSAKEPFIVIPRDVRFAPPENGLTTLGPVVERFDATAEELVGKPDTGTGINVGVLGREVGVGKKLLVVVVLKLAPERRDAGRRIPAPEDLLKVGEGAVVPGLDCPVW